jgi:hypothetical protein
MDEWTIMNHENVYGIPVASDSAHDWCTSLVIEGVDIGACFQRIRDGVIVAVQSGAMQIIEGWGHVV